MERTIKIDPVTRIEGHAKVTVHLDEGGEVQEARFHVTFFRGFETFCTGRPFYEMPSITSRACGICPVSHLIASAKACDQIVSVTIPRSAVLLRRLMHMGQIIQSHALSFFHLSSPDFLVGMDAPPEERNIFAMIDTHPKEAKNGIMLRKFGQEIIERTAGKKIHSSDWIVPGGVKWPLSTEKADQISSDLPGALEITLDTISLFKDLLEKMDEGTKTLGDFPSHYMGLVTPDGGLEHYDGRLRVVDPVGKMVVDQLDPDEYFEHFGEAVEPWSYMKFPFYRPLGYPEGTFRVGPLARLNVADHCGTPLADEELKEFRKLGNNNVVQSTFHYHYARLIEILHCIERSKELLEEPELLNDRVWAKAKVNQEEGIGVAEAPRGTLVHHYRVDKEGIIRSMNMVIATEHSNTAFNQAVTQVAKRYLSGGKFNEGMLNRVEAVIRAFDPCLSCSTHSLGRMALDARIYDSDGTLVDRRLR